MVMHIKMGLRACYCYQTVCLGTRCAEPSRWLLARSSVCRACCHLLCFITDRTQWLAHKKNENSSARSYIA